MTKIQQLFHINITFRKNLTYKSARISHIFEIVSKKFLSLYDL